MGKAHRRHVFKLTERELEVLQLMTQALSNREISEQLNVGVEAIRMHAKNIYAKLRVSGRHQASIKALELGLIPTTQPERVSNTNLPTNLGQFIGRQKELLDIFKIFERGEQLITIVGAGGMGKTRLALEYAQQHLADYADGVFFISLEAVQSTSSIILQIVEKLTLPVTSKSSHEQQVFDFLSDKQMLLVVDNWEHLLDGASILNNILEVAPDVHILATSREILSLHREVVYRLDGLAIPEAENLESIYTYDAVQFVEQVAQRQIHDWAITPDNITSVMQLCHLTDGMPLGIMLAVSWISVYPLEQILQEIQKSITFLQTDLRDLPQRHRSIPDVFEWTWELLTIAEQRTFMQLSVFRNGCTIDAVKTITKASPQILHSLMNKSLIYRSDTGRYLIHELLRQFAELKLKRDAVIEAETRDCHATYYAEIAERMIVNQLIGKDAIIETDNLYAAWYWVVDTKKFGILRRFVSTFGLISYQLNNHMEVKRLFNYALESPAIYENEQLYLLGSLKLVSPIILLHTFNRHQAYQLLKEGEEIFKGIDWTELDIEIVYAFYYRALAYRSIDYKLSLSILEKVIITLESHQKVNDIMLATMLTYAYSQTCHIYHIFASELEKAKPYGIQALQMARKIRHKTLIALNTGYLGHIDFLLGNHEQATHYFRESISVHQHINSIFDFGYILLYAGENALVLANYDEARTYLKRSLDLLNGYGPINGMLALGCVVALWKYQEHDYIGATELVAYCLHSDDDSGRIQHVIQRMWGMFSPPIKPQAYQLATEKGKTMDYDTFVRELYIWLE